MKEVNKLDILPPQSPDYNVQLNYLETVVSLPWGEMTEDDMSLKRARKVLDEDHYGLTKQKDRILEYLAVKHLTHSLKSPILCLFGPPGTGKTSLAISIARALGRKFVKISLGGVSDEAELRGHHRPSGRPLCPHLRQRQLVRLDLHHPHGQDPRLLIPLPSPALWA